VKYERTGLDHCSEGGIHLSRVVGGDPHLGSGAKIMSPRPKFTGYCRFCGCTSSEDEANACNTTGGKCHWFDYERTVCSAEPCIRAFGNERAKFKAERAEKDRKRTPAEIHALIMQERKDRRKKKAGAA